MSVNLLVTLWPSFPHFKRFAHDPRLAGIRLNSAMMSTDELDAELKIVADEKAEVPLYYDIKGRQLRIREVHDFPDHLEITINHPIKVEVPTVVLFKAGADFCVLDKIVNDVRLVFQGGPKFKVKAGESLHIRSPRLQVSGPTFCDYEIEKMKKVVAAGFERYFLSYVETQKDVDEFREHVGKDAEVVLKIENKRGLMYVLKHFKKDEKTFLMAARGDLYVEIDKPHHMMEAMRLIIAKDRSAFCGSRMLLSMVNGTVPELADLTDLAWTYDVGYRSLMLCDELCLKEELLAPAVNVLDSFKKSYCRPVDDSWEK